MSKMRMVIIPYGAVKRGALFYKNKCWFKKMRGIGKEAKFIKPPGKSDCWERRDILLKFENEDVVATLYNSVFWANRREVLDDFEIALNN